MKCRYYGIEEINILKILRKSKSVSMFLINAYSLSKNFDDLEYLLKTPNFNSDIRGISETRIPENISKTCNIILNNYAFESTPYESSAGTLIYVANFLAYKPITEKKRDLESTFIEIIKPIKSNINIGCIYRQPNMDLHDFNNDYLNPLLAKLSKEKKTVFLLYHYNSKYEKHSPTDEFLDYLASSVFVLYIIQPRRVTSSSKTITGNIFSNIISANIVSGNLKVTISDHLPQFLVAPEIFRNSSCNKSNKF